jgi:ribosomal protein S7
MAMADGKPAPDGDAALAARLEQLENKLRENDALRRKTRLWSLLGVLIILVLLLGFVFRLYNHLNREFVVEIQKDPEQFLKAFIARSDLEGAFRREAQLALTQLNEEVRDKFLKALAEELQKAMPELETKAVEMGGRLADHAEEHVQQKINDALAESLEACFDEIEKAFPDLEEKDLEKHMAKAQEHFVERLHDVIEERYAKVDASLTGLKGAVKGVRNSKGSEELGKMNQGEVAEKLLDALVDVIVYELKPDLGAQAAE